MLSKSYEKHEKTKAKGGTCSRRHISIAVMSASRISWESIVSAVRANTACDACFCAQVEGLATQVGAGRRGEEEKKEKAEKETGVG